jgi:prepilin-type N-terminal cleavage/methylation domain-containing protein/prepilin-type processing-associated H-X9-DG protein
MTCTPQSRRARAGFTLVELLVVIAIIGILVAILMPGITNASRSAQRTECLSNLKQVGVAVMLYAEHNLENPRMYYPYGVQGSTNWTAAVAAFIKTQEKGGLYVCPASTYVTTNSTYSAHGGLMPTAPATRKRLTDVRRPSDVIMVADAGQVSSLGYAASPTFTSPGTGNAADADTVYTSPDNDTANPSVLRFRHRISIGPVANVVFADGHVESFRKGDPKYKNFDFAY